MIHDRKKPALKLPRLIFITPMPDLTPREVVSRYQSLADIKRGFRILKSEIEIGPVYHRLPDRIRTDYQKTHQSRAIDPLVVERNEPHHLGFNDLRA